MSAVDAEIRGHVSLLDALASSRALRDGNIVSFRSEMERFVASQQNWRTVILSDADGNQLLNAKLGLGDKLPDDPDLPSLKRATTERKSIVGGIVRWQGINGWGIAVRLPVV